jgi:GTPase involved in cell partitioning and DNA repair
MVDDSLLPHIEKIQSAHHVINLQREEIDKQNTIIQTLQDKLDKVEERAISRLTYWMRSAYVIKIELNTKLIFTDLEDNRVSINGLDNV